MAQVQQIVDSLVPDVPVEMQPATKLSFSQPSGEGTQEPLGAQTERDSTAPQLLVVDRDAFGLAIAHEWVLAGLPRNRADARQSVRARALVLLRHDTIEPGNRAEPGPWWLRAAQRFGHVIGRW